MRDPVFLSDCSFRASREGCEQIVSFMRDGSEFLLSDHVDMFMGAGKSCRQLQSLSNESLLGEILSSYGDRKARAVRRAVNGKCSNWLNVVPIANFHSDLFEQEFRDALTVRYYRPVVALPAACDAPSSVAHALSCRKGGLVIRRHNEVRDALGEVMAMAFWKQVMKEHVLLRFTTFLPQ